MRIAHLFDDPLVKSLLEAAEREDGDDAVNATSEPQPPLGDGDGELEFA